MENEARGSGAITQNWGRAQAGGSLMAQARTRGRPPAPTQELCCALPPTADPASSPFAGLRKEARVACDGGDESQL